MVSVQKWPKRPPKCSRTLVAPELPLSCTGVGTLEHPSWSGLKRELDGCLNEDASNRLRRLLVLRIFEFLSVARWFYPSAVLDPEVPSNCVSAGCIRNISTHLAVKEKDQSTLKRCTTGQSY